MNQKVWQISGHVHFGYGTWSSVIVVRCVGRSQAQCHQTIELGLLGIEAIAAKTDTQPCRTVHIDLA